MDFVIRWLSRFVLVLTVGAGLFACGGGGGEDATTPAVPSATRTLAVVPALGGFSAGATVSLISPAGAIIGSATTDASGAANPVIGAYTGPFIIRVSGGTGVTFLMRRLTHKMHLERPRDS